LTIVPHYDGTDTVAVQTELNSVVSLYSGLFSNNLTVNIDFNFGSTGLGQSLTYNSSPYNLTGAGSVLGALQADSAANPTNTYLSAGILSLQNVAPVGDGTISLTTPNARLLGDSSANPPAGQPDSTITFTNNPNTFETTGVATAGLYDLANVAEHEIDEVLGIGSALDVNNQSTYVNSNTTAPLPTHDLALEDEFRYSSPGVRCYTLSSSASCYFSYDGGTTNVASFNQGQGADYNDWSYANSGCPASPAFIQDAFGCPGVVLTLSRNSPEVQTLQTLGYDLTPTSPVPEPASFFLLGSGLLALARFRRRE
jgi:hypothetical protein